MAPENSQITPWADSFTSPHKLQLLKSKLDTQITHIREHTHQIHQNAAQIISFRNTSKSDHNSGLNSEQLQKCAELKTATQSYATLLNEAKEAYATFENEVKLKEGDLSDQSRDLSFSYLAQTKTLLAFFDGKQMDIFVELSKNCEQTPH
jgi:hypothetical protein